MEGLRRLAITEFEAEQRFEGQFTEFTFTKIKLDNEQGTITTANNLPMNAIVSEMTARASTVTASNAYAPELKLVQIRIEDPFPFYIEKQLFLPLFESLNADPYILHLIIQNSYGFHRFPATVPPKAGQAIYSFLVSTILYMLVWSFNPETMETKGVLMTRRANGMTSGREVERYFSTVLPLYKDYIYSPGMLGLAAGTQLIHFLDNYIMLQLDSIRQVEAQTGHGDTMATNDGLDVHGITQLSKESGRNITVLANIRRHLLIARAIIEHTSTPLDSNLMAALPPDCQTKRVKNDNLLMDVVSTLETQITWNESYVTYITERAKSQAAVLQSLLTHADAAASIELAKESAQIAVESAHIGMKSAELAAAAKKDSSAMKTIAVMTMAFLPGTFFAALFAIPLLKWDEANVIQEKFWVYWAFTLPATALVFILWQILTSIDSILKRHRGRRMLARGL